MPEGTVEQHVHVYMTDNPEAPVRAKSLLGYVGKLLK